MVQTHSVFKVPDRALALGVAVMIALQIQQLALTVGDEETVAVAMLLTALQQRPQVLGYPAHALTVALLVERNT